MNPVLRVRVCFEVVLQRIGCLGRKRSLHWGLGRSRLFRLWSTGGTNLQTSGVGRNGAFSRSLHPTTSQVTRILAEGLHLMNVVLELFSNLAVTSHFPAFHEAILTPLVPPSDHANFWPSTGEKDITLQLEDGSRGKPLPSSPPPTLPASGLN